MSQTWLTNYTNSLIKFDPRNEQQFSVLNKISVPRFRLAIPHANFVWKSIQTRIRFELEIGNLDLYWRKIYPQLWLQTRKNSFQVNWNKSQTFCKFRICSDLNKKFSKLELSKLRNENNKKRFQCLGHSNWIIWGAYFFCP